jgi:hypothetical protein
LLFAIDMVKILGGTILFLLISDLIVYENIIGDYKCYRCRDDGYVDQADIDRMLTIYDDAARWKPGPCAVVSCSFSENNLSETYNEPIEEDICCQNESKFDSNDEYVPVTKERKPKTLKSELKKTDSGDVDIEKSGTSNNPFGRIDNEKSGSSINPFTNEMGFGPAERSVGGSHDREGREARVRLNEPLFKHINTDIDVTIYLLLTVNEDGVVVAAESTAKTTTTDQRIIKQVIVSVKSQLKYSKQPGAGLVTQYLTVKLNAS